MILAEWERSRLVDGGLKGKRGVAQAAILSQQQPDEREPVLQLQLLAIDVILTKLHLQQVVAQGNSGLQCDVHVLGNICQQSRRRIHGFHFLLQRDELPEIFLCGALHLVFRELQLQGADLFAETGELVAIDDLSAGKDGLGGNDTGQCSFLHHRDADGISQSGQCLGGQRLS